MQKLFPAHMLSNQPFQLVSLGEIYTVKNKVINYKDFNLSKKTYTDFKRKLMYL